MPIKFRCHHCNQLMGIAKRKAGTEVQCPTCLKSVTVPEDDHDGPEPAPAPVPVAPAPAPAVPFPAVFERSDFEEILKPPRLEPVPAREAAPRSRALPPAPLWPPPAPAAPSYGVEPVHAAGNSGIAPAGILLTPGRATVLTVVGIFLLGCAFGAGLMVGRLVFSN